MHITLQTSARLLLDDPRQPNRQSLYLFGSHGVQDHIQAAVKVLAGFGDWIAVPLAARLAAARIGLVDAGDYSVDSLFLPPEDKTLTQICALGGYFFHDLPEVPAGFVAGFRAIGASALLLRDPRDMAVIRLHAVLGLPLGDMARLGPEQRAMLGNPVVLGPVRRAAQAQAALLRLGVPSIRHEELIFEGTVNTELFAFALHRAYADFLPHTVIAEQIEAGLRTTLAHQDSCHSAMLYRALLDIEARKLRDHLADCLDGLGYD